MDKECISELIRLASSKESLAEAHKTATEELAKVNEVFPTNGCAATLSALFQSAGIDVPMTLSAQDLKDRLENKTSGRGWDRVDVGNQQPGDVGVCFPPKNPNVSNHVYLVVARVDDDKMLIADNQDADTHPRFASGNGKTPTGYFLRAV